MDHALIVSYLAEANAHIVDGERHIARQRTLIERLVQDGYDTRYARALLAQSEELQQLHVLERDRVSSRVE